MMSRTASSLCLLGLLAALPCSASLADAFGEPMLLADLVPGEKGSAPVGFLDLGDRLLFSAAEPPKPGGGVDRRLWTTDGTAAGTFRLPPASGTVHTLDLRLVAGLVLFVVEDEEGVRSLWRTDGTAAGTVELARNVRFLDGFVALPDGRIVFAGLSAVGETDDLEPWVTDGTPAGTFRLRETTPEALPHRLSDLVLLGDTVYFRGFDPSAERIVVWRTDGTPAGTEIAIEPPSAEAFFADLVVVGSRLLIPGRDGDGSLVVWASDGTDEGTVELAELGRAEPGLPAVTFVTDLSDADPGRTIWYADGADGPPTLWGLDGTPGGAEELAVLTEARVPAAARLGDVAYFVASTAGAGFELVESDGTAAGTGVVVDFCPGPCDGLLPREPTVFAGRLLLKGAPGTLVGVEPVVSDGTAAGTRLLADVCPGRCHSSPQLEGGVDLGGAFVFAGSIGSRNEGPFPVWATDLSSAEPLLLASFPNGVGRLGRIGGRLLVSGNDGVIGLEPWVVPLDAESLDPLPPPGPWLTGPGLDGFEVKARFRAGELVTPAAVEPDCIPEALCLSGFLPGRAELFVRVIGPRPNGYLWPVLTRFTPSEVEIWIRQQATGTVRHYLLPEAEPGVDELPGLFDRTGFLPAPGSVP